MGATYHYDTGKIERTFKFVKIGIQCRFTHKSKCVGDTICKDCKYHKGIYFGTRRIWGKAQGNDIAVLCEHPKAVDFRGSGELIRDFNIRFESEALCNI